MSFASSHSESRSVELSTHRSRVMSRPFRDSVLVAIVPLSSALVDSGTTDTFATMRSFFNVDSTVTTRRLVEVRNNYFITLEYELHVPLPGERPYDAFSCGFGLSTDDLEAGLRFSLHLVIEACLDFPTEWTSRTVSGSIPALSADETKLVEILRGILSISKGVKDMNEAWLAEASLSPAPGEMFNLSKMKSDGGAGSGSTTSSATSALVVGDVGVSTVEKRPSSGVETGLRKHLQKAVAEQPADASGCTARSSANKGKGTVELGEALEQGYTMRELCEVEDRAGADRYFASIMTRLKGIEGEDPLVPRWSTIFGSSPFWT
ncbi:hypothetical protein BHE74_00037153 [Ensete ventricosum]|nr:hypothetical protein BHE74_00037153 [Ensete ventricosum]